MNEKKIKKLRKEIEIRDRLIVKFINIVATSNIQLDKTLLNVLNTLYQGTTYERKREEAPRETIRENKESKA